VLCLTLRNPGMGFHSLKEKDSIYDQYTLSTSQLLKNIKLLKDYKILKTMKLLSEDNGKVQVKIVQLSPASHYLIILPFALASFAIRVIWCHCKLFLNLYHQRSIEDSAVNSL